MHAGAERSALVAGGGIGGLTAALALARAGIHVDLFERAAGFREIGAGIQLSPNATRVLAHAAAGDARIRLHPGAGIEAFEDDGAQVRVHTTKGDCAGDVLVGADGIHSRVREGLFGARAPAFTGNVAWRALVPTERLPPAFVAPAATVWMGPGRHFVHYYVRGGALVNCVCVVEKAGWEVESWTQQGDHDELCADFAGWHDGVTRLVDAMDRDACFKWALFDRPPMAKWGRGRTSLLGDACHPTLPFMAQGAAMAIEDAAVLAGCLDGAADVAAALRRYEGLRRERTAGIQLGSRRNAGTFHLVGEAADARDRALAARPGQPVAELFGYDATAVARKPG